jgi:hypothetical protein
MLVVTFVTIGAVNQGEWLMTKLLAFANGFVRVRTLFASRCRYSGNGVFSEDVKHHD